jgi:hypothetical protein
VKLLSDDLQLYEEKASAGTLLSRDEAEQLLASADLLSLGVLGEAARRRRSGERVSYGRVCVVSETIAPASRELAGEVRLIGKPASADDAVTRARACQPLAGGEVPLTAYSLGDLLQLVSGDHLALAELARALSDAGVAAVAEAPVDAIGDTENAIEVVRAANYGGLGVWRATVGAAEPAARLDLIARALAIQQATGALRAFAPLPRQDPIETPATGYDDVLTIAVASLMTDIPLIQVDWPLYGPKLAQVAIAYGANDIDGIAASDDSPLGPRRAPGADVDRQIRAAAAAPAERDGRYRVRGQ